MSAHLHKSRIWEKLTYTTEEKILKVESLRGINKHWRGKEKIGLRQSPKCLHQSEG